MGKRVEGSGALSCHAANANIAFAPAPTWLPVAINSVKTVASYLCSRIQERGRLTGLEGGDRRIHDLSDRSVPFTPSTASELTLHQATAARVLPNLQGSRSGS